MKREAGTLEEFERTLSQQGEQVRILRLYVSGPSPKSTQAIHNIKKICDEHLPGQYELTVVDKYQPPRVTADELIVAATDDCSRLRYPAGADSVMLAALRQSLSEQAFMARMRTMFGDGPVK